MKLKIDKAAFFQLLSFIIVGFANAFVMLAVYYVFLWINPQWYLIGNMVGWAVSVINAYILNWKFTFKEIPQTKAEAIKKLGKSYLSYGATFCFSTILLWLEVDVLTWSRDICPIFNILITTPLNFFLNKFWIFAKQTKH